MKNKQKKINHLKLVNKISIGILALIVLFVAFLLYVNVYQTISHSKEIIVLRSQVILKTPNVARFSAIKEMLDLKTNSVPINFEQLKNIFTPIEPEEGTEATTTE